MWTYFLGWRRKAGCVTLVMACVVMGIWMRSYLTCDQISFRTSEVTTDTVSSLEGFLTWSRLRHQRSKRQYHLNRWQSIPSQVVKELFPPTVAVEWRWYGFGFTKHLNGDDSISEGCLIPYWSVTIPLTMLSAYLLLSKPRPVKEPEPTVATGT